MTTRVLQLAVLTLTGISPAHADLNNCENLYVGRIWVEKGYGLRAVVLLDSPTAPSGSYWTYFTNWTADERKAALATFTAAKLAGHRVSVETEGASSCATTTGGSTIKAVYLATVP